VMAAEFNKPACLEFEALLEDHVTGDLGNADAAKLADHLESCVACTSALEDATASVDLLRTLSPVADPGPGFSRMMMVRVRQELAILNEQKSIWQPFISLAWRFAATATLALAMLVTFDAVRHNNNSEIADLRPAGTRELFPDPGRLPANRDEVLMMVADTNHGKR
jgi:anti-sigma factor RsiW